MLLSLLTVIARLLGPLDRASRLDLDCRQNLPGWPVGLSLASSDPI